MGPLPRGGRSAVEAGGRGAPSGHRRPGTSGGARYAHRGDHGRHPSHVWTRPPPRDHPALARAAPTGSPEAPYTAPPSSTPSDPRGRRGSAGCRGGLRGFGCRCSKHQSILKVRTSKTKGGGPPPASPSGFPARAGGFPPPAAIRRRSLSPRPVGCALEDSGQLRPFSQALRDTLHDRMMRVLRVVQFPPVQGENATVADWPTRLLPSTNGWFQFRWQAEAAAIRTGASSPTVPRTLLRGAALRAPSSAAKAWPSTRAQAASTATAGTRSARRGSPRTRSLRVRRPGARGTALAERALPRCRAER